MPPQVTLTSPVSGASAQTTPLTLSWDAASGATSYNVYLGYSSSPASFATGVTGTSTSTGSLTAGTTYYWNVAGVNSIGAGTASANGRSRRRRRFRRR